MCPRTFYLIIFSLCNIQLIAISTKRDQSSCGAQNTKRDALIIMDMWDKHWCKTMTHEGDILAKKINEFAQIFRARGGVVIHTTYFANSPISIGLRDKTAKIFAPFSKFRGCKCPGESCKKDTNKQVWSNIHPDIYTDKHDLYITNISKLLKIKNIQTYFFVGQHINECILERPIGVLALKYLKKHFYIIKDLTNHSFCYTCPEEIKQEFFSCVEQFLCPLLTIEEFLNDASKN